jgi:hypothetical protein
MKLSTDMQILLESYRKVWYFLHNSWYNSLSESKVIISDEIANRIQILKKSIDISTSIRWRVKLSMAMPVKISSAI